MANINVGELIVVNTLPTQTQLNNQSITVGGVTKTFQYPVVFRKVGSGLTNSVDYTYRNAVDAPVASFNPDLSLIQNLKIENGVLSGIQNVLTVPQDVTDISATSFNVGIGKPTLVRVNLNEGLLNVGDNAFQAQSINVDSFPTTLLSIGSGAFNLIKETSVTLPATCTYYANSFKSGTVVTGGILIP